MTCDLAEHGVERNSHLSVCSHRPGIPAARAQPVPFPQNHSASCLLWWSDKLLHRLQRDLIRQLHQLWLMLALDHPASGKVFHIPAFPHLTENNIRKGFLEGGQYPKIVVNCPELWFWPIVECRKDIGLANLRTAQHASWTNRLGAESDTPGAGDHQNREGREIVMTGAIFTLLSACVQGKTADEYVFTRSSGKRVRDFRRSWEMACEAAGVPGLLFHDLRRTAARNLRRAGVPETAIMKIGGWRTRSVFERYAIVSRTTSLMQCYCCSTARR